MKYTIVKGLQTVVFDTQKFKTYDDWKNLLHEIGLDLFEISSQIEQAKAERVTKNKLMPPSEWKRLNGTRRQRIQEWRTVADHIILIWPEEISFTSNQFMRIVREKYEDIFKEVWPEAAVDPTMPKMSKDGRPKGDTE